MSVLGLVLLCTATADAQSRPNFGPQPTTTQLFGAQPSDGPFLPSRPNEPPATGQYEEPEFVPYVNDLQLFDQPDLSAYGRGPRPTEGWFGSAEALVWAIQAPPKALIGAPGSYTVFAPGARTLDTGNVTMTTANPGYAGTNPSLAPTFTIASGGVTQISSVDTGFMESQFTGGSRFEFGRINDGRGWLVSTFQLGTQTQTYDASNVSMNFLNNPIGFVDVSGGIPATTFGDGFDDDLDGDSVYGRDGGDRGTGTTTFTNPQNGTPDPLEVGIDKLPVDYDDAVPLPTVFRLMTVENRTSMYGVEAMRMWRVALGPRGGIWEIFLGPRYINIKDNFNVTTSGDDRNPAYYLDPVADAYWNTATENNVFGLQFGGRWAIQRDRWQFSVETRGLTMANFQNAQQNGQLGSLYYTSVTGAAVVFRDGVTNGQLPHAFQSSMSTVTFTPGGELRTNLKYQVFRSVYLQLGYTAMYLTNIARANQMVTYRFPDMGLNENENKQNFFVNGVDFGIVINR